ncbi:unnamed protein product, partial [Protopolystoma xenopodis]
TPNPAESSTFDNSPSRTVNSNSPKPTNSSTSPGVGGGPSIVPGARTLDAGGHAGLTARSYARSIGQTRGSKGVTPQGSTLVCVNNKIRGARPNQMTNQGGQTLSSSHLAVTVQFGRQNKLGRSIPKSGRRVSE